MKPATVTPGQVWRARDGREVRIVEVTPHHVGACARVKNLVTGKLTWIQAWSIATTWRLLPDSRAA